MGGTMQSLRVRPVNVMAATSSKPATLRFVLCVALLTTVWTNPGTIG